MVRVKLDITDAQFFNDAQNKRESVRIYQVKPVLPHWIEEWDSVNGKARVWVKIPNIPAGGSVEIKMYYGNANAQDLSNGHAVFDFFDDFETFEGWQTYGSGQVTQSNAVAHSGTYSAKKDLYSDPNGAYKDLGFTLNYPFVLEAWINRTYLSGSNSDRIGVIDNSGNGYGPAVTMSTPDVGIDVRSSYSGTAYNYSTLSSAATNDWYFVRFIWDNGSMTTEVYYNDQLLGSTTYTDTTYNSFTRAYLLGGYTYFVDDFRIRKYADPEPTVTIGTEQPSDAGGWQYMRKITITNPGTTDLTDFQVAINLDQSNFDFSKAQSTGADVRFVIEDPSPYKASYYIEEWDPSTPRATIWVALDENDPDFYIEVNPSNNTDDSDVSVMNLPESDVHTVISKFVRENV